MNEYNCRDIKYGIVIDEDERICLLKAIEYFQDHHIGSDYDELLGDLNRLSIELENLPSGKR